MRCNKGIRGCSIAWLGGTVAILTVLESSLAGQLANDADQEALQMFKSFVASPPVISRLVFEIVPPQIGNDELSSSNLVRQLFLARIQTNAFYFRQLHNLDELDYETTIPPIRATGSYGKEFWRYNFELGLLIYVQPYGVVDKELETGQLRKNEVLNVYNIDRDFVSTVLNLGAYNLPIGSIVWFGNRFDQTNASGVHWHGEIIADSGKLPTALRLRATKLASREIYEHEIAYVFESGSPFPYLPSEWLHQVIEKSGNSRTVRKVRILILETNATELPRQYFAWDSYTYQNTNVFAYTNQHLVHFVGGKPKIVAKSSSTGDAVVYRRKALYIWIFLFVSLIGVGTFAVRQLKTRRC